MRNEVQKSAGVESAITESRRIMLEFADRTGLSSDRHPPRRYLWTDAHAVCNFLSLYRHTTELEYLQLARMLIDQVHHVLGKHRDDDPRSGWISGLDDAKGEQRPTAGGLRIGKKLPERGRDEAFDERLEWDRDGQYFHYITKWMHALCRAATVCNEAQYCHWAIELASAAHAGFTAASPLDGAKRLIWKMSIDLSYPLVPSSGLHDALDGYITCNEIAQCANRVGEARSQPVLQREIADTRDMIRNQDWRTGDPLGIGGLLFDACRAVQLTAVDRIESPELAEVLLEAAGHSLRDYRHQAGLGQPAQFRLAFRELGLATGLRAITRMQDLLAHSPRPLDGALTSHLAALRGYVPMADIITNFWCSPASHQAETWHDHADINCVMLATTLLPDEFLAA